MYLGVSIHQKSDKFLKKTKHFSKCLSCFLPRKGTQQKDLMVVFENTNAFELKVPTIKTQVTYQFGDMVLWFARSYNQITLILN